MQELVLYFWRQYFFWHRTSYGAKLSLLGVQPSEAIKITFVFFMACISVQRYQF